MSFKSGGQQPSKIGHKISKSYKISGFQVISNVKKIDFCPGLFVRVRDFRFQGIKISLKISAANHKISVKVVADPSIQVGFLI